MNPGQTCLRKYPAAPTGLVPDEVGTVGAREKKILPLEQNYSGFRRQVWPGSVYIVFKN